MAKHRIFRLELDICARANVGAEILQRVGPAGGNALWKFQGTRTALRSLVAAYTSDAENARYLLTLATEVT